MKRAYILHGCCDRDEYYSDEHPSPSNHHWIPWLQKQLLIKGFDCQTLDMILASYSDAKLHTFESHGHFCLEEMGTDTFPELLATVLNDQ